MKVVDNYIYYNFCFKKNFVTLVGEFISEKNKTTLKDLSS